MHKAFTRVHTHIHIAHTHAHTGYIHTADRHAHAHTHTHTHSTYTRVIVSQNILSWKGAIRSLKSCRRLLQDPHCHFSSPGCSVAIRDTSLIADSSAGALALGHLCLASPWARSTLPATSFCIPGHYGTSPATDTWWHTLNGGQHLQPCSLPPPPTHTAPVGAHLPPHNNPNAQQHEARATFAAARRSNVSPCVEFRECLQACSTAEPQTLVCVCPTSAQPGGTLPPQPHVRSYALQTAPKPALKDTPKAHRNGAGFQKHYSRAPRCSPAEATHTARGRAEPRRFPAALAGQLEFISGYF